MTGSSRWPRNGSAPPPHPPTSHCVHKLSHALFRSHFLWVYPPILPGSATSGAPHQPHQGSAFAAPVPFPSLAPSTLAPRQEWILHARDTAWASGSPAPTCPPPAFRPTALYPYPSTEPPFRFAVVPWEKGPCACPSSSAAHHCSRALCRAAAWTSRILPRRPLSCCRIGGGTLQCAWLGRRVGRWAPEWTSAGRRNKGASPSKPYPCRPHPAVCISAVCPLRVGSHAPPTSGSPCPSSPPPCPARLRRRPLSAPGPATGPLGEATHTDVLQAVGWPIHPCWRPGPGPAAPVAGLCAVTTHPPPSPPPVPRRAVRPQGEGRGVVGGGGRARWVGVGAQDGGAGQSPGF
jgi:hypothetical protein